MGTNTLQTTYANGGIIDASHPNEITQAIIDSFVGRDSAGSPAAGKSLGTVAIPWGTAYLNNLVLDGSSVDTALLTAPKNRIVSGATRSTSNQPQFITPNGAAASFTLDGATTNLVLDVNATVAVVSTDITKSSLTLGPSTTETCLVNSTDAADQESTRTWGEYGSELETLPVNTMGAEMQAFIGQYQVMSHGSEYFLGFIKSATEITNCRRGYFTNSTGTPTNRDVLTNNDVITVLSTGWVFVEDNGTTVDVTYTTPIRSYTAPGGPSTGDYWYDMANQTWKRYDGATFIIIDRTLVGVVGIDSANCVVARSFDFYHKASNLNTVELEILSTSVVQFKNNGAMVDIYGSSFKYDLNHENFNITTDLAVAADMYNATEQASTDYYMYLSDEGETFISDISPYYSADLGGIYTHPHNPWRCVGEAINDSSSDIIAAGMWPYNSDASLSVEELSFYTYAGNGSSNTYVPYFTNVVKNTAGYLGTSINDSTSGCIITGRKKFIISISFSFAYAGGGGWAGVSKNGVLTSYLTNDAVQDGLRVAVSNSPSANSVITSAGNAEVGRDDVIAVHTDTTSGGSASGYNYMMTATLTPTK